MLRFLSLVILSQFFTPAFAGTDPNLIDRSAKKNKMESPAKYAAEKRLAIAKDSQGVASVNTNSGWTEVKPMPQENRPAEAGWGFAPIRVEGDDAKFVVPSKKTKVEVPAKNRKATKTLSSGFSGFTPTRDVPAPAKKTTR
jgi:hypothetical protein